MVRYAPAEAEDYAALEVFYREVCDAIEGGDDDPRWVWGIHPCEAELRCALDTATMLVCWADGASDDMSAAGERFCSEQAISRTSKFPDGHGFDCEPIAAVGSAHAESTAVLHKAPPRIAAAIVLDGKWTRGYEDVAWRVDAPLDRTAVIHLFAVHPDFRGRGLARGILDYAMEVARRDGFEVMRFDVIDTNLAAQRAYGRMGFTNLGPARLSYAKDARVTDFVMFERAL